MCGRFTLHHSTEDVATRFAVEQTLLQLSPRYNIAPSQSVAVIVQREERQLCEHRWGLLPSWAKDPKIGNRLINARSESLVDKPAFKNAFRHRRCLVPTSGYFEWKKDPSSVKVPHYIQVENGQPFAMAGVAEKWRNLDGEMVLTCAIITTEPCPTAATIHDRMPAILSQDTAEQWLDPEIDNPNSLLSLLKPYPGKLYIHRVSPLVNHVDVDESSCVAPMTVQQNLQLSLDL